MKTLEPFLEAFKKTEAEEMRLEPGERLSMVMTGHKIPVGREPMQPQTLLQMASEALNPADLSALAKKAHQLTTTYSGQRFEVTFSRPNGAVHIVVRKAKSASGAAAPEPKAAPQPKAVPSRKRLPRLPRVRRASPPAAAPKPGAAPPATSDTGDMDSLLRLMVESGASDLHLSSGCVSRPAGPR